MAEIKISELSIGDWVMNLYANKPSRVIGLRTMFQDTYEIIAVSDDTQYMLIEDNKELHNFEPIPLTPETLEKNGFGKVEPQWYMCEHNGIHISVIVWKNQRGRIEISYKSPFDDDNPLYIADFTANIPHIAVHHLQRILQLAGVEKEIEV